MHFWPSRRFANLAESLNQELANSLQTIRAPPSNWKPNKNCHLKPIAQYRAAGAKIIEPSDDKQSARKPAFEF